MRTHTIIILTVTALLAATPALAKEGMSLRGGLGTDISGGPAFGIALNFVKPMAGPNAMELGLNLYRGGGEYDSNNGFHDYHEETTVGVFAASANLLIAYNDGPGVYGLAGFGFGAFAVEWSESSLTDDSLGRPFGANGSIDEEEGTAGGTMFNIGVGSRFSEQFDLRLEAPVFMIFSAAGDAAAIIPTVTITGGIRF